MAKTTNGTGSNGRTAQAAVEDDENVVYVEKPFDAANNVRFTEIPVDDGDSDNRAQLSKLSLSLMGCRPELSMKHDQKVMIDGVEQVIRAGKRIHQATIFGAITHLTGPKELPNAKTEEEKITYGLCGIIEGVNVLTGEMFKAGTLYLPGGFHDMFLAEMEIGLKGGDSSTQIAFALEFWSIPSDNPRGYSWQAINKMPMEKRDPLARLRQRAMAGTTIKTIDAPKDQVNRAISNF